MLTAIHEVCLLFPQLHSSRCILTIYFNIFLFGSMAYQAIAVLWVSHFMINRSMEKEEFNLLMHVSAIQ